MGCNSACAIWHRPRCSWPPAKPSTGEIVAEVTHLAESGVREITLLGQNVNSWGRDLRPEVDTEFGEVAPCLLCGAGHRAHPVHEPASEGLPCARRVCDRRVLERLRARPPTGAVGIVTRPQSDAADVRSPAIPEARRDIARCGPRSRPRYRSHRWVPRRVGRRLPGDALARRRSPVRQRLHLHLLAPRGNGSGVNAESCARSCQTRAARSSRRACAAHRRRAQRPARRSGRGGARRGPGRTETPSRNAAVRAATRRSTSEDRLLQARSSTSSSRTRRRRRSVGGSRRSLPRRQTICTLSARFVTHAYRFPRYACSGWWAGVPHET